MGVNYQERAAYDVLFNGFAVKVSKSERLKLATVSGIKAMWPIDTVEIPEPEDGGGSAPNLDTAIKMTGANIAQSDSASPARACVSPSWIPVSTTTTPTSVVTA